MAGEQLRLTAPDCSTTFQNQDYKSHTSCISEAEKYQGKLYKGARKGNNNNTPSNPASSNATPADSPAPPEAGTSTIHPSRLNQMQEGASPARDGFQSYRGRGGFQARGRGAFGARGGRGGGFPARSFRPTGENLVTSEVAMRSWGSTPAASDSETPAASSPATDDGDKKKKKRKGDKGGTGVKANSRLKHESTNTEEEAPASKKRKFEEAESTPTESSTPAPPSDKALKRLRKHMSKLESKSETSIPLAQWLEKVAQGKEKSVDKSDILQGVQVAFVDGAWRLSA